tara:strand:- start:632 stop:820 length:189 start_codon:yes stop_codon:yes gene_type:complete
MSIIRCDNCEQQLDSDFVEFEFYKNEEVCISCYDEMRGDGEPDYDIVTLDERHRQNFEQFKR